MGVLVRAPSRAETRGIPVLPSVGSLRAWRGHFASSGSTRTTTSGDRKSGPRHETR